MKARAKDAVSICAVALSWSLVWAPQAATSMPCNRGKVRMVCGRAGGGWKKEKEGEWGSDWEEGGKRLWTG